MKRTIELLKRNNMLRVIDEPVDIYLEMAHIAYAEVKKEDSKALLFTQPTDRKSGREFNSPVLMNLYGSYDQTKLLFGKDVEGIADEIEKLLHMKPPASFGGKLSMLGDLFSLKNIFPTKLKGKGECHEVLYEGDDINLYDIPTLTTWEEDGGPFITMGQVYTQSLDGDMANLGMYRLQIYDKNHLGLHWQIHKDASHFFDQYQEAGKKMPVTIAVGGDPLYTWCATAPLPYGVNELLLYGFIKKESAKCVKSLTNNIYIPRDVDYVIEGWVDTDNFRVEGPFGDHTGYYTLEEPYPELEVSLISHKKNPVFVATVVGKPPLEDKYMGWPTERIFLPLLKTTVPALIDYHMPENGVFHNLILAKMKPHYKGHAKQFMHAFWGAGQMSFVKHAIFVDDKAPRLDNYLSFATYVLNRLDPKKIFITDGITDALDHSSPEALVGGKLGLDATSDHKCEEPNILEDNDLEAKLKELLPEMVASRQLLKHTKNPVTVITINKVRRVKECFDALTDLSPYLRVVVFIDDAKNDIDNQYMTIWRVVNNMDAQRDVFISGLCIGLDGTNKTKIDGFTREWPGDVECTPSVVAELKKRGLWDLSDELYKKYQLS
ncbi:MAG: menaquinone biosynthesis decarboxylase [Helicobacteraceae bacterium]|nr:menaquinone biosynthesis decarboxylase [Helicobacteraceae bacterium]